MDRKTLFSSHSLSSCVSEGCSFLGKNLPMIARVMMPYLTVASFLSVLSIAYNIKLNVAVQAYGGVTLGEVVQAMALFTLSWLVSVLALARLFLMYRRLVALEVPRPDDATATRWTMMMRTAWRTLLLAWRSMPYTVWLLIINMPGFPVISTYRDYVYSLSWSGKAGVIGLTLLLALVLMLLIAPMVYTFFCRMMKPNKAAVGVPEMSGFGFVVAYRKGFRNEVKILSLVLWGAFLLGIACAVILLPGWVSTESYLSAVEGDVNYGDPALIPTYGYALMIALGTIAVTLCGMLSVAYATSLLYLFGDIFAKEK